MFRIRHKLINHSFNISYACFLYSVVFSNISLYGLGRYYTEDNGAQEIMYAHFRQTKINLETLTPTGIVIFKEVPKSCKPNNAGGFQPLIDYQLDEYLFGSLGGINSKIDKKKAQDFIFEGSKTYEIISVKAYFTNRKKNEPGNHPVYAEILSIDKGSILGSSRPINLENIAIEDDEGDPLPTEFTFASPVIMRENAFSVAINFERAYGRGPVHSLALFTSQIDPANGQGCGENGNSWTLTKDDEWILLSEEEEIGGLPIDLAIQVIVKTNCDDFFVKDFSNVKCDNLGFIEIELENPSSGSEILWSTGERNITRLDDLEAGEYWVEVSDGLGCLVRDTFEIKDLSGPESIDFGVELAKCKGESNGSISALVNGGTQPFNFIWSNGEKGEGNSIIRSLGAGTYSVLIIDAIGCEIRDTVFLGVSDPEPEIILDKDPEDLRALSQICFETSNLASLNQIRWEFSDGGSSTSFTECYSFLSSGEYRVSVETVSGNCTYMVDSMIQIQNALLSDVGIWPNPSSKDGMEFVKLGINLEREASFEVVFLDLHGREVKRNYFGNMNAGYQVLQLNINSLQQGLYHIGLFLNGELQPALKFERGLLEDKPLRLSPRLKFIKR